MTEDRFLNLEADFEYLEERLQVVEEGLLAILDKKIKQKWASCEVCFTDFYARRGAKYCSKACRQFAYRERKKDEKLDTISAQKEAVEKLL